MRHKTVLFTPFGLTAGALMKMAGLGLQNTHITLRQLSHTGKTKPLRETFTGFSTAIFTDDITQELQLQVISNIGV
jgi:hypothetical protein